MKFPYYVVQKYDDGGRIRTKILTANEAKEEGYEHGFFKVHKKFDIYVDGFNTLLEAKQFCRECTSH